MSRDEAAAKAIDNEFGWVPNKWEMVRLALAAADAWDAAHGIHRISVDDATVERAGNALYDHREDALVCYDHDNGWCCVCGDHEIDAPWFEHAARAMLAAATQEES
jgi:hypothetical protein